MVVTGDSFTESIDNVLDDSNPDQNFESYHTPPSSPIAELDDSTMSGVFVTPPPRPGPAMTGTATATTGLSPESRIPTPPCTTLRKPSTIRPRLSDAFADQVPDIPVPNDDPGRGPMTSATLGPAPAGPSVTWELISFR
jgi:hypothetical protein